MKLNLTDKKKIYKSDLELSNDLTGKYFYDHLKKEFLYKGKSQPATEKRVHTIRLSTKSQSQFIFVNHTDYSVKWMGYYLQDIDNQTYITFDYNEQTYLLPLKYSPQEVVLKKYNPNVNENNNITNN